MRKLFVLLFVLAISLPSFAGLKEKDVLGKWTYKVETPDGTLTGFLKFEKKEGKLSGEVITSNGETVPFVKVEIRDNSILYFEIEVEYQVIKATLTVEKKKYTGTIAADGGEMTLNGEKVE